MTLKEKFLYHEIHPLKLCVDFSTGLFTTYLSWHHNIVWFLILFLIPSVIITALIFRFADLERLKNSSFGNYIGRFMTPTIELIRFAGQIIMWVAGWFQSPLLIAIGFLIILGGWSVGLFKGDS